ncbi:MAG: glycosyltransferase family 4 protein [Synechococcaceae cyanobacterium SM2_3_60]|nr:glycosyltransferase family 4 protein [Synechococcaceae cyanobacterium SM2_3_60]
MPLLEQLSHEPAQVQTLAQRARQRVLERYTLQRNLDQLEALYQRLI